MALHKKVWREIGIFVVIIAILLSLGLGNQSDHNFEITFLDVGQGDAILIRTPENQKILVDAGPAGAIMEAIPKELNFWERRIDLAILTHPDVDHAAGFVEILDRFEVERILLTGIEASSEWYREILRKITEQNIPTLVADDELDLSFGEVKLDIFWPTEPLAGKFVEDANASSISFQVNFGKTAAILTGDLPIENEKIILQNLPILKAQILKLGHHGSKTSSSVEWINTINPKFVVVSAGAYNHFGHPAKEVLARVADREIFSTAENGNLKFISDGEKWKIELEK